MKISILFPIEHPDFWSIDSIVEAATLLERLGFHNASVTDHPCPTGRWLDAGGHKAQDPFVVLAMIATATRKLKLQTGILVLPYRNPMITARAVATLDYISAGRVILGVGLGYMKGEYAAVGADFERRNEIMDEYLRALKAAWTADEFTFEGSGYRALGNRILPTPAQKPHPPLWCGGNSKRAIRRAVELGDAWFPFFTGPVVAKTGRTVPMTEVELAQGMRYMREYCEQVGRATPPEVVTGSFELPPGEERNANAVLDKLGALQDLGLTGLALPCHATTRAAWTDHVQWYGAEVLPKFPSE